MKSRQFAVLSETVEIGVDHNNADHFSQNLTRRFRFNLLARESDGDVVKLIFKKPEDVVPLKNFLVGPAQFCDITPTPAGKI